MYENGAEERYLTAVFTFASDAEHEREMRDALVDRLLALANELGHDVAVAHDAELPDEILLDGMSHVEPEPVQLVHRRDLKEGGRYTLSDGLEFTVLENNADGLWVENPEATNAGWLTDGGPFRLVAESEWAPSSGASGAQAGEASTEAAAEPFDRSDFEALVGNAGWGIRSRWSGVFLVDAHESEEAAWAALPEALATAVEFTFSGSGDFLLAVEIGESYYERGMRIADEHADAVLAAAARESVMLYEAAAPGGGRYLYVPNGPMDDGDDDDGPSSGGASETLERVRVRAHERGFESGRPSATAVELRLWAGSLESIARDIERGVEQVGDKWDEQFARAVGERLANVESLLQQARLEAVQAGVGRRR